MLPVRFCFFLSIENYADQEKVPSLKATYLMNNTICKLVLKEKNIDSHDVHSQENLTWD